MAFGEILTICRILGVRAKKAEATILFVNFSKAFDSIHRGKMEQILLANGLTKETRKYKSAPLMQTHWHCSRCTAWRHISPIPLYHLPRLTCFRTSFNKMNDIGFMLAKERSRSYPAQRITDADYAADIALLANTPTQTETLLHGLERAVAFMGLHVDADKTVSEIHAGGATWLRKSFTLFQVSAVKF